MSMVCLAEVGNSTNSIRVSNAFKTSLSIVSLLYDSRGNAVLSKKGQRLKRELPAWALDELVTQPWHVVRRRLREAEGKEQEAEKKEEKEPTTAASKGGKGKSRKKKKKKEKKVPREGT